MPQLASVTPSNATSAAGTNTEEGSQRQQSAPKRKLSKQRGPKRPSVETSSHGNPPQKVQHCNFSSSLGDPSQEVLEFKAGDRALRKNEACTVIAVDQVADSYTVQLEKDGRIVDTLPSYLTRIKEDKGAGGASSSQAYPSQAHEEESCPICCRPVLGENCVPCCQRCEESRWLHRRCLLGLVCQMRCPAGHALSEADFAGTFSCGQCCRDVEAQGLRWQCSTCSWGICRRCITESLDPEAICPTCRAPLPMVQGCQYAGRDPQKFDEHALDPLFCRRRSTTA